MAWTYTTFEGLRIPELSRSLYEFCTAINERERVLGMGDYDAPGSPWAAALETAEEMEWLEDYSYAHEPFMRWLCHDGQERAFPTWEQWSAPYEGQPFPEDFEAWLVPQLGNDVATINEYFGTLHNKDVYGSFANPTLLWHGQWSMFLRINLQKIYYAIWRLQRGHDWARPRFLPYSKPVEIPGVYRRWYWADTQFSSKFTNSGTDDPPPLQIRRGQIPGQTIYIHEPILAFGVAPSHPQLSVLSCYNWIRDTLDGMRNVIYAFGIYRPAIIYLEYAVIGGQWRYRWVHPAERSLALRPLKRVGQVDSWRPSNLPDMWAKAVAASPSPVSPAVDISDAGYYKRHYGYMLPASPFGVVCVITDSGPPDSWTTDWVKGAIISGGIPVVSRSQVSSGAPYVLHDGTAGQTPNKPTALPISETTWITLTTLPSPGEFTLDESYRFTPDDAIAADPTLGSLTCETEIRVGRSPAYCAPEYPYVSVSTDFENYNHVVTDITGELTYG